MFGWQRPCYLLGESYAQSFRELMDETNWDLYGTGNYEKCADCMAHCGYEASAVSKAVGQPWRELLVSRRGIRTEGAMAPEIPLDTQRPAEFVFERLIRSLEAKTLEPLERESREASDRRE